MKVTHKFQTITSAALLLSLILISTVAARNMLDTKTAEMPQLIALRYHADWCGACTKLAPTFDALKERFEEKSILFLTFDFTEPSDRKQSEYLAGVLGLGDMWRNNPNITGRILIIDRKSKQHVDTFLSSQSLEEMGVALDVLISQ